MESTAVMTGTTRELWPQDGPVEVWSSIPTARGETPARKIAGAHSWKEAERIADECGLSAYFVFEQKSVVTAVA